MQMYLLILTVVLIAVLALQVMAWLRAGTQRNDHQLLEAALRQEQRIGRSELREQLDILARQQEARLEVFARQLAELIARTDNHLTALRQNLSEETSKNRQESALAQQQFAQTVSQRLHELTAHNDQRIAEMRHTLEARLKELQADNAGQLEQMRHTVDEKLQSTLTTRLDSSFSLISQRLEHVQRGLGQMQQLATGVGDLKRVFASVKDRGGWGEVQLDSILENTLTAEQYARNVALRPDRRERVDFAVRLPGRNEDHSPLWLPLDCKFPREDYERLLDAQDAGDVEGIRHHGTQLERALRVQAKSISEKYIFPPHTTDFAVMFLPTEGLYAEAVRRAGLVDSLQREHRVVIAGPTTITALLNSLQIGFRTLAIEKRSGEVWKMLGAVKTEFGKFAGILEKAGKQVQTVGRSLDEAAGKSRTIERRLRHVETLPVDQAQNVLLGTTEAEDDAGEENSP